MAHWVRSGFCESCHHWRRYLGTQDVGICENEKSELAGKLVSEQTTCLKYLRSKRPGDVFVGEKEGGE